MRKHTFIKAAFESGNSICYILFIAVYASRMREIMKQCAD